MNILYMITEELSWWELGQLNPEVHTPHLDALANRAQRFEAAYAPSPICIPARAALDTGKYVHEIGNRSSARTYTGDTPSWGHALQEEGYHAASIGILHYRSATDDSGFAEQIEPIHIPGRRGWMRGLLRKPLCSYDATAELAERIGPGDSTYLQYDCRVTENAVRWLHATERKGHPWASFVSWLSPHYSLIAPQEYYDLYNPKDFESETTELLNHLILEEIGGLFSHEEHLTPETRGIARASYYALCTFLDAQIGAVLNALKESGQAESTLIFFTSDHGAMPGEKGLWTKCFMYDGSARSPLQMVGPDMPTAVREEPVSLIELTNTLTNTAEADSLAMTGVDLREPLPERVVIGEHHDGASSVGVTMLRWNEGAEKRKYIHYSKDNPPQLFELVSDPGEVSNLAETRPECAAKARAKLFRILDPEAVNARAHADQAALMEKLGGREALLTEAQRNFTPADSH